MNITITLDNNDSGETYTATVPAMSNYGHGVGVVSYETEKIRVIKVVRGWTGWELRECKDFVESLPKDIPNNAFVGSDAVRYAFEERPEAFVSEVKCVGGKAFVWEADKGQDLSREIVAAFMKAVGF